MKSGAMEIVDCNNHVKTATEFFGPSCAVNALLDANNPIGDNSDKLCRECIGKIPGGRCTDADPYAGYEGAFKCLLEAGDVAFLKHTTIQDLLSPGSGYRKLILNFIDRIYTKIIFLAGLREDQFQLLCKDGSKKPINQFKTCNWGEVPTNAIVVSSATLLEDRVLYQKFLDKIVTLYTNTSRGLQTNYDNPQPEYDSFGNRVRRQVYQDSNRYDPYNDNRGYNRNPYQDPFGENPNLLNPNRYGVNIDPYGPVSNEYDGRPEDLPGNGYDDDDINKYNDTKYEYFTFYESIPRFGNQTNLLFQVSSFRFINRNGFKSEFCRTRQDSFIRYKSSNKLMIDI